MSQLVGLVGTTQLNHDFYITISWFSWNFSAKSQLLYPNLVGLVRTSQLNHNFNIKINWFSWNLAAKSQLLYQNELV